MRLIAAIFSVFGLACSAQASEPKPVIMQSLCAPETTKSDVDPFGFELIQTGRDWAARIYPASAAVHPVPSIEIPNARVSFVDSPNAGNVVITLSQSVEIDTLKYSVIALSEVVSGNPEPFSVTLHIGKIVEDGSKGESIEAACAFVNEDTPYERKSL